MKLFILIFTCSLLLLTTCNGFTQKKDKPEITTIQEDENGNPAVTIKVNKHFDKYGNLVSFDSIYSSYYSTTTINKKMMDSLVTAFKKPFSEQFPFIKDQYFKTLFFTDSLVNGDFFHEDFFRKRMEINEKYVKKMLKEMDEFKNDFFRRHSDKKNRKDQKSK
ncbi:MAG: hypothetical protein K9G64_08550 [Bacteroidia bacterium]|nr:hypothetical protein [Bacteroidia bacterium]